MKGCVCVCDPSTVLLSDISRCDLSYGPRGPRDKALNCVKVVFYFMTFFYFILFANEWSKRCTDSYYLKMALNKTIEWDDCVCFFCSWIAGFLANYRPKPAMNNPKPAMNKPKPAMNKPWQVYIYINRYLQNLQGGCSFPSVSCLTCL